MSDWRSSLLHPFARGISRKTVVADPDDLFRDDKVFRELTDRGFTVIYFEDSVSFRFTYESEFRELWDKGTDRELVVVVRPDTRALDKLPADVLQGARRLEFYLQEIFPNLSYTVVSKLDRAYFDHLHKAHEQYAPQPLGEALTKEFILKHVFETVPELVRKDSDLLRLLLHRHYRKQQVPAMLDEHFLSILAKSGRFADWPLKAIVPDRGAFWTFLQERWPLFVNGKATGVWEERTVAEAAAMQFSGVYRLPFDHDDVRVYIDNLFTEGLLKPIQRVTAAIKALPWLAVGMDGGTAANADLRFDDLCSAVEKSTPPPDAPASAWLAFAYKYGQMQRVWNQNVHLIKADHGPRYTNLRCKLNEAFAAWVSSAYRGLYNHPAVSPVMVHHIPAFLANRLAQHEASKVALVIIDGLAMDQWLLLKDTLTDALSTATTREAALMAWIPTITPVSRQAAYSGKLPVYFSETVYRTDRDEYGWRQFWSDRGMQLNEVGFCAVRGDAGDMDRVESALDGSLRAFACTVYKVDEIMHGVQVGSPGMAAQVSAWAADGFLASLIKRLLHADFHIVISADHGNTGATGIGSPKEGALSETKGERCRVFSDIKLRAAVHATFPTAIPWDHQGLPKDFHALLAPADAAFVQKGQSVVSHGGISIEEVMVPFVEISRRKVTY